MAESFAVRLAREELVYLLRALRIAEIPGAPIPLLGDLDADHTAEALAIADRTLRARGVVRWKDAADRDLDPLIAGVLRNYAAPQVFLALTLRPQSAPPSAVFYSFTGQIVVLQTQAEPGVYLFMTVGAAPDVLTTLRNQIALPNVAVAMGNDVRVARAQMPATRMDLALWRGTPTAQTPPSQIFSMAYAPSAVWMLHPDVTDPATVTMHPTTTQAADAAITAFLQAALAIVPKE
jgi:hypothetical protein